MKTVLILAANPKDTSPIRLDQEVRDIREGLQRSRNRDQFVLECRLAVRPSDMRRALLEVKPQIVHFSGHGQADEGLLIENDAGEVQPVRAAALAGLFELFANTVECVILNACYVDGQAQAISQHINHVIGMTQEIGDRAAIEFAVGFYDGLGAGQGVEFAYKLGCNAIAMAGVTGNDIPVLKQKLFRVEQKITHPHGFTSLLKGLVATPLTETSAKIFISYRSKEPDLTLAQDFYSALQAAGHEPFMAAESIRLGENWSERIDKALEQSDYFLLLLSPLSAVSEMVIEEVRRAKQLRDTRGEKPTILPIRVNFPLESPLNYDLRGYLSQVQQREWKSPADTVGILQEVLSLIATGRGTDVAGLGSAENVIVESSQPLLDSRDHPPIPVAEPELPEGQVDLASVFYVKRPPIEARCYETITQPGALICIKAPRQMGKTSLMSRILHHSSQQGYLTVPLSFQIADAAVFNDLDRFLKWFCASVGRRLRLPNRLDEFWDAIFGSKDNCRAYFEEYLLAEISRPLVLGLDEVDMVFKHPQVAADFFGMLRTWHESSKTSDLWKMLRLIVVHSTEVYIPMDINQSPFNVGLRIKLPEITADQIQDLAQRHGLVWGASEVEKLMSMVGGHPYLVRVGLYHIARKDVSLESLLQEAPTEAGLYGDHLRRHLWNLAQRPEMLAALKEMLESTQPVRLEPVQAFQLNSMGLLNLQGNEVTFRSNLYRQYFRDRLGVG